MTQHLTPARAILFLLLALFLQPQIATAQVDVTLFVDPYPSPYIADWEVQAGIISLTVMNGPTDQELVVILTIEESGGREILRAESDPRFFAANEVVTYSSVSEVSGSIDYDSSYEDNILRTGRLPEGEFQICVSVEDAFGTEVSPRQCESFTILLPDPAYLLAPMDEEIVRAETPFFQWTPLQLPFDFELSFVLQIVEVLEGQMPYEAITSNILHFEDADITVESYQYPLEAAPFEEGKTYAWWVLALDQEGLAVTSNQGRSEIWTFTWLPDETELFVSGDPQSLRLVPAGQAAGPLSDFDTSSFETVVNQIGLLTSAGAAIEIPLAFDEGFEPITVDGVHIYIDTELKSLAIRGQKIMRNGKSYDIMLSAYWGSRHDPRNKALSVKGPEFEGFFPAEGFLDELSTTSAWVIISLGNFTLKSKELPPEVQDYYDTEEIGVKLGLNLYCKADVKESHWLADVATALDINQPYIELQGFIGPTIGAVFDASGTQKLKMGAETTLSAAIPLWIPERFRGAITELKGQLELGAGFERTYSSAADSAKNEAKVSAQISLEAKLEFPFLVDADRLSDALVFTGAVKLEKSPGEKIQIEVELGAKDIFELPAFKNVFSMHDPKVTITFERNEEHTQHLAFSAKCDVGRYKNAGAIKIERVRSRSAAAVDTTTTGETPPPGGVPTPFKQAELLAKQKERDEAAKKKPKTDWVGKWAAEVSIDPLALGALRPRELLLDLFNFAGNLDMLPDGPDLNSLSLRFLPEVPGSITVAGSTMLQDSPTYFIASRVKSMEGKTGMVFGVAPQHWSFKDNFPDVDIPLISELEISNVGLLFATEEFTASSDDLFGEEYGFYHALYQRDDFMVTIKPGINLVASLPVEGMDPESPLIPLMDKLGVQRGPALLQGAIGGQVKDLYFRASLPPISPPGAPEWFVAGQLDVELTGQPSIALIGSITVKLDDDIVMFFVKTKAGKEGLIVAGGMDAPGGWHEPFGIEWMTINRTVLLLGLTPTGSIQMGFEGDLVIGESDIRVAVLAAINVATGVPTNFMFDGESEAGVAVADLVDLQARIAVAGTDSEPEPIPTDKLPLLGVEDLKLKFAPKDSPELNIDRGLAIGGMLTIQSAPNKPPDLIAMAEFDIGGDGLIARAAVGDFEVGPVSLTDAAIDLTLTRAEQYFRMSGQADLTIMQAAIDIDFALTEMSFDAEGKAFGLFMADIHAQGKANLTDPGFTVVGTLQNDFYSAVAHELLVASAENATAERERAQRTRDAAISAHNSATAVSKRARDAWVSTPMLPRNGKNDARNRWIRAMYQARSRGFARLAANGNLVKWLAVEAVFTVASSGDGSGSPIKIRYAKFDGDLSRIKDGQVAKLDMTVEVQGNEMRMSSAGFNFRNMGAGLVDIAAQIVRQVFRARG